MTTRALCVACHDAPAEFTIRRAHTFGTGPYEHVCGPCAPDPSGCAWWSDFASVADDAARVRAESEARRLANIETGRAAA